MKIIRNLVTFTVLATVMATSMVGRVDADECCPQPCEPVECYDSCCNASMLVPAIALGAVAIAAIVIVATRNSHHHHHNSHSGHN